MAPLRPASLLLLLFVALGVLAVPCCCNAPRYTRNSAGDAAMLGVGPENVVRPSRPKVFTSPEELRGYLEALSNYYAIAGRPRFGKRVPATQALYDVTGNFRHLPSDVYDLFEPPHQPQPPQQPQQQQQFLED